jgi:hypothetical protein
MTPQENKFSTRTTPLFSRFNVTFWIADVSDLLGWQIALYYDSVILNCTGAWQLIEDPEYVFYGRFTIIDGPVFRSDYVLLADHPVPYARPSFNGTGKLCTVEFEIFKEPLGGEMLSCILDIARRAIFYTFILDYDLNEIPLLNANGYYEYHKSLRSDLDDNGKVDMKDIGYVARRFMCTPTDPLWDPIADINSDGKIDMSDIGTVARHFGEVAP